MHKPKSVLLFFLFFIFGTLAQGTPFGWSGAQIVALQQNEQVNNPAAFATDQTFCFQSRSLYKPNLPNHQLHALDFSLKKNHICLSQQIQFQGIPSYQMIDIVTSLGMQLDEQLKVGVGLGVNAIFQNAYYGNLYCGKLRVGLQYKLPHALHLGFAFYAGSRGAASTIAFSLAKQLQEEMTLSATFNWKLGTTPQLGVVFYQQIGVYLFNYSVSIGTVAYSFSIQKEFQKSGAWCLGSQYQKGIGLGFLVSFKWK
jgi:hypothetical protein